MNNLISLKDFSTKKTEKLITESVVRMVDGNMLILTEIPIPQTLINAYVKKVKDASKTDIKSIYGDQLIAEKIVDYVKKSLINIDNLPVNIVLGEEFGKETPIVPSQAQPNVQDTVAQIPAQETPVQEPVQTQVQEPVQTQVQAPVQTQVQTQVQAPVQGQATQGTQEI